MDSNCTVPKRPGSIKEFFRSWYFWKPFLGVMAGAGGGFLFWYFIGCTSGSCPVTSNPWASSITGGVLGFLITSSPCLKCR